jgi:hypothetical protein
MKSFAKLVLMATFALFLLSTFAAADTPGPHPKYLHALSDLRRARAHLNEGSTGNPQADAFVGKAADEVNRAINDLIAASYNDGKDPSFNPPPDVYPAHSGRLHHVMDILDTAFQDVNLPESDPRAIDLQRRTLHHLEVARRAIADAIHSMGQ